jgi:hypothetical protein
MRRLRELRERMDMYDVMSIGLIVVLVGLALSYWSKFPVHMDSFYHMGVAAGYAKAGGVALHSFWEYAPAGRAQLYPPLLHIVMFVFNKTGLSMLSVARLVSFSAFPLLLLSGWYGMRALFSRKAAFYTTVVLSSCYLLFWHSAVESAAALVLILTPLIFVAVDRDRKVAAAILLALALYSHLTLGHLVAFGLLIYAIHRREMFKEILLVLVGAYVLWLPWGIHILVNYRSLSFSSPGGGSITGITVHVLVWLVALAGFIYCYFKKGKYYLLPSFMLGMIPIVFFYPDRFWNAHIFLPLAMLGGAALAGLQDFAAEKMTRVVPAVNARKFVMAAIMAVPVALLLLLDPVYATAGGAGVGGRPGVRLGRNGGVQRIANQTANNTVAPTPQGAEGNLPPLQQMMNGNRPPVPPGMGQAGGLPPAAPGVQGGPMGPGGPGMPGGPGGRTGLSASSTTLLSLAGRSSARGQQSLSGTALIDSDTLKMAQLVKDNSSADAIVYSSDGSVGNLITGLTGRASTGGMFHEVSPTGGASASTPQNASIIVVAGQGQALGGQARQGAAGIDTSGYTLIGTAGRYKVYKNAAATATSSNHGAVIPWFVVFTLLGLAIVIAGVDWFRPRPGDPSTGAPAGTGDPNGPAPSSGGKDPSSPGTHWKVLAIVPCYNEAGSVSHVIGELKTFAPYLDVLVVDDGSVDDTARLANGAGAIVVSHVRNLGIGATMRTGMLFALEAGYQYAVQVDGDGQHDPRCIGTLLEPLESGSADVVVGSRFLGVGGYKPPLGRRIGIKLLARVVSVVSGRRATDTTSGFRAMNRRAMSFLVANYPDDFPESESLVLMDKAGIEWREAPVHMRVRSTGVSSITGFVSAYYMAKVLMCIVLDTWGLKTPRPSAYAW